MFCFFLIHLKNEKYYTVNEKVLKLPQQAKNDSLVNVSTNVMVVTSGLPYCFFFIYQNVTLDQLTSEMSLMAASPDALLYVWTKTGYLHTCRPQQTLETTQNQVHRAAQ